MNAYHIVIGITDDIFTRTKRGGSSMDFIDNDIRYMDEYYEIKEFIDKYGTQNPLTIIENFKKPIGYVCPNCHGEGTIQEKYNAYPTNLPDSGWVDDWQYRDVECPVCHGKGFNKNRLKPKMVQQGWEE